VRWSRQAAARRRLAAAAGALLLAFVAGTQAAAATAHSAPPRLAVRAAALLDGGSGRLLYGVNPDRAAAIASTTKLMTALVTLEHASLRTVYVAPPMFFPPGDSQIGLRAGERMTVHDLLLAMLLPSADDAAQDLAFHVGGGSVARFVAMMNARAAQLGLAHTHYTTPVGLDTPGNYSSASDLVKLARYVLRTQPFFRHAVALPKAVLRTGARARLIVNLNDLVGRVPWVNGVKTGHTLQAGYVLVGSGARDGMSLISVVLGTPSAAARDATTLALLRFGFRAFHPVHPVRAGAVVAVSAVRGRPHLRARVVATRGFTRVIARDAGVSTRALVPRVLEGPLARGARVGTLLVLADGRVLARIPLVLAAAVPAPPAPSLAGLALPITILFAVVLALGAAVATGFGRKRTRGRAAVVRRRQ
jgi:D-alanyl-D-alanine carboxypeptidase (penicillin-binding protein 5/6)